MVGLLALVYLIVGGLARADAADTATTTQVSVHEVTELVTRAILERFPSAQQQVQVTNVRVRGNLRVPLGDLTYEIIPRTRHLSPGPVSLAIVVHVDGKPVRRLLVSATLSLSSQVVVAAVPLARHQTITRADIQLAEVDLARLSPGAITVPEDVVGKQLRRNVSAGTPLLEHFIEAPTVVQRGDVVMMVAQSSSISISVQGQAKEDGSVGEHIRVLNLSSGKEVYAKVLDENTVLVDF